MQPDEVALDVAPDDVTLAVPPDVTRCLDVRLELLAQRLELLALLVQDDVPLDLMLFKTRCDVIQG